MSVGHVRHLELCKGPPEPPTEEELAAQVGLTCWKLEAATNKLVLWATAPAMLKPCQHRGISDGTVGVLLPATHRTLALPLEVRIMLPLLFVLLLLLPGCCLQE